jgi:hypothetical protein
LSKKTANFFAKIFSKSKHRSLEICGVTASDPTLSSLDAEQRNVFPSEGRKKRNLSSDMQMGRISFSFLQLPVAVFVEQGCQMFLGTTYQNGKKYTK